MYRIISCTLVSLVRLGVAAANAVASVDAVAANDVAADAVAAVDKAGVNNDITMPPAWLKSILSMGDSLLNLLSSAFNSFVGSFILVITTASIAPLSSPMPCLILQLVPSSSVVAHLLLQLVASSSEFS